MPDGSETRAIEGLVVELYVAGLVDLRTEPVGRARLDDVLKLLAEKALLVATDPIVR